MQHVRRVLKKEREILRLCHNNVIRFDLPKCDNGLILITISDQNFLPCVDLIVIVQFSNQVHV